MEVLARKIRMAQRSWGLEEEDQFLFKNKEKHPTGSQNSPHEGSSRKALHSQAGRAFSLSPFPPKDQHTVHPPGSHKV